MENGLNGHYGQPVTVLADKENKFVTEYVDQFFSALEIESKEEFAEQFVQGFANAIYSISYNVVGLYARYTFNFRFNRHQTPVDNKHQLK